MDRDESCQHFVEALFRFQAESRDMNLCGHEFVEKVDFKQTFGVKRVHSFTMAGIFQLKD